MNGVTDGIACNPTTGHWPTVLEDREDERLDGRWLDEESDRYEKHHDHKREQKVSLVSANEHPKFHEKVPIPSLPPTRWTPEQDQESLPSCAALGHARPRHAR